MHRLRCLSTAGRAIKSGLRTVVEWRGHSVDEKVAQGPTDFHRFLDKSVEAGRACEGGRAREGPSFFNYERVTQRGVHEREEFILSGNSSYRSRAQTRSCFTRSRDLSELVRSSAHLLKLKRGVGSFTRTKPRSTSPTPSSTWEDPTRSEVPGRDLRTLLSNASPTSNPRHEQGATCQQQALRGKRWTPLSVEVVYVTLPGIRRLASQRSVPSWTSPIQASSARRRRSLNGIYCRGDNVRKE